MENFKLIEERKNILFKRKEIKFSVKSKVTPSHSEVGKFISEKFSTPMETIKIKNILGKFGSNEFVVTTNIYNSKEDKEITERKSKKDDLLMKSIEAPKEEIKENVSEEKPENLLKEIPSEEKPSEEKVE